MRLIAVDPGGEKKGSAVALFDEDTLVWVKQVKGTARLKELLIGQRAAELLVIEYPVAARVRGVDPNDLIAVAFSAGIVAGAIRHDSLLCVKPQQWKGSRPKKVDNDYTKSLLSPVELALLPTKMTSDLWDAVGIGLWAVKRR